MSEEKFNINELITKLSKDHLDYLAIVKIFKSPKEYPSDLIEKISIKIALAYWKGEMEYISADILMNNIYAFWSNNQYYFENSGFSEIAWECYDAFDSGEYYRKEDGLDIDPAEKYTKPLIEKLLKKNIRRLLNEK